MSDLNAKIAAAKQEIATAKQNVAAAKQGIAAAETKYSRCANGSFQQRMAAKEWEAAGEQLLAAAADLKGATEVLAACRKAQISADEQRPPLHPNSSTRSDGDVISLMQTVLSFGRKGLAFGSCSSGTRASYVEDLVSSSEDFVPRENKPPVITTEEASLVATLSSEKRAVAFLLPKIEACFADDRVVVDSQDFPWLPQYPHQPVRDRVKPDGFITHPALCELRDPSKEQVVTLETRAKTNGVPADDRFLVEDLYVIEGKNGLTQRGQLELVDYLHLLDDTRSLKGVVIGKEGFWLINAARMVIQKRIKAKWTDPGSMELLADFFPPSKLCEAVTKVCNGLGCEIATERFPFLGAGSYGHVFCVHKKGETLEKALKVAIGNKDLLLSEFKTLETINQRTSLPVVTVEKCFEDQKLYAGYIMTQVGRPIEIEKLEANYLRKTVEDLFASLNALHIAEYTHGDPRLENAINVRGSMVWIDFMSLGAGPACNERAMRRDFKILAKSFFAHKGVEVAEEKLQELVSGYDGSNHKQVIESVMQNLSIE